MITSLLIANRGEIACRIIRTAKSLGIRTIAVYSDADARAPHVMMADEAYHLGASPARLSYLDIDKIIAACRATSAEAVHPGYGFLSENVAFAERLIVENITFIGPNPEAMRKLGDKIASKALAVKAGVSVLRGSDEAVDKVDDALSLAQTIGFPVIIKASAGGGGKGMRIARNDADLIEGFPLAQSEALSSFNDERVFIEKFIDNPRHIEIQVLGDKHGNVIHLGERECSLQRRNQKVVEESPSVYLDADTRSAMAEQAVRLAQKVGYDSAGTVEFIVDQDSNFYFLEMNTRLQVEHPVTELVTGLDLVEHMIRVGSGEVLTPKQNDITFQGWSIECRLNAEDPARNFLPSTGRIQTLHLPEESLDNGTLTRIDTGVIEGSEISMFYDSMVAKIITHAPTRELATQAMKRALNHTYIKGIKTNLPFLSKLMTIDEWTKGDIATTLIGKAFPEGFQPQAPDEKEQQNIIALAAMIEEIDSKRRQPMPTQTQAQTYPKTLIAWLSHEQSYRFHIMNCDVSNSIKKACIQVAPASLDPSSPPILTETTAEVNLESQYTLGGHLWRGTINGELRAYRIERKGISHIIAGDDHETSITILNESQAKLANLMPIKDTALSQKQVLCPMPGLIKSLNVEEGQAVHIGDALCVIEAMKMENVLRAEVTGTVKTINVNVGDNLAVDTIILEID